VLVLEIDAKSPADDYLRSSERSKSVDFKRLVARIAMVANTPNFRNTEVFNAEGDGLYAFKTAHGLRLYAFFDEDQLLIACYGADKPKKEATAKRHQTSQIMDAALLRRKKTGRSDSTDPVKNLAALFSKALDSMEAEVETAKLRFTEELLALMEHKKVSRVRLAKLIGVKPARITALLDGSNNFTLETMVRLCRALGAKYEHHVQMPGCITHWYDIPQHAHAPVVKTTAKQAEMPAEKIILLTGSAGLRTTLGQATVDDELALAS
jgi:plasmid maintenance system antidote protein VapI